jgi:6-pyruvoyltetrahydropterin/6-carboxytetrahydropterin synthase
VVFVAVDAVLHEMKLVNGEENVKLHSIIVHETETGYAQCFREDAYSEKMGIISLESIVFSDEVKKEWNEPQILNKIFRS